MKRDKLSFDHLHLKDMNSLYDEIHSGMDEFRMLANEAWNDMQAIEMQFGGANEARRFSDIVRIKRHHGGGGGGYGGGGGGSGGGSYGGGGGGSSGGSYGGGGGGGFSGGGGGGGGGYQSGPSNQHQQSYQQSSCSPPPGLIPTYY